MSNFLTRFNKSINDTGSFNTSEIPFFPSNQFQKTNPDTTTAPILLGVGGGLLFISLTLLTARIWSRTRPVIRLHADDWTLLGGAVLTIISYAILSFSVVHGLGRRMRFVRFSRRRSALRLLFIAQVFWYWAITLVKLSVACLLLRVKHSQRRWRIFLYIMMTIIIAAVVVQTCFQFLQCRPFSVFWDARVLREGPVRCFPAKVINGNIVAFAALQVFVDLVFSFIPITFIRKLNRPRREKIFMCVLMALGLFASGAAIVRTLTLPEFYKTDDLFRSNVKATVWAVVELQFALIAATIPTLKAVLEKALLRVGTFFYKEENEKTARSKLVAIGLLGIEDQEERTFENALEGWKSGEKQMKRKENDLEIDGLRTQTDSEGSVASIDEETVKGMEARSVV
ncbi:hypothetical protein M011DRAFT_97786 [Sporormia fimetaria CBS 119925]|uniref:Rhodopsin domain-containing protein n=1 Tax=Sporormia fimetaria CBS 119925 TaxID=1340428 RepID=A0A6A6V9Y2_9PLEO|nr:hypothetical protein M011DRAFT_97786 [Sporormia fimetaria CBS 119925]